MQKQAVKREQTFPVVCIWCGSVIRQGSTPESSGMCEECFKDMVDEHNRLAMQTHAQWHASER